MARHSRIQFEDAIYHVIAKVKRERPGPILPMERETGTGLSVNPNSYALIEPELLRTTGV